MTLEEIKEFHNCPITEEDFETLRKSDLVYDIEELGSAPYFPELTWCILYLVDRTEVHVFL